MNVNVIDREVQFPYRIKLTPVAGTSDEFDVSLVPGTITAAGTEINKAFHDAFKNAIFSLENYRIPTSSTYSNNVATLTVDAFLDEYVKNRILHLDCVTPEQSFNTRIARTINAYYYQIPSGGSAGNPISLDIEKFNTDISSTSSSGNMAFQTSNNNYTYDIIFELDVPIIAKDFILRYYSGTSSTYRAYRSNNYAIYASNDGDNWNELYTGTESTYGDYIISLSSNSNYYRYYKFKILDRTKTIWLYGIRISDYIMRLDTITDPLLKVNDLATKTISGTLNNGYLYDLIYDGTLWKPYLCANQLEKRLTDLENAIST